MLLYCLISSQECFKAAWATHKLVHTEVRPLQNKADSPQQVSEPLSQDFWLFYEQGPKTFSNISKAPCTDWKATIAAGGYPSPLNYYLFPKSCCTSVNEVICHGIPDSRRLEDGDIVNVDVTVYLNGCHGDLNETFFVGEVDKASEQLVRCTYECLQKAIALVKPGVRYREVGEVISRHACLSNFSVVKSICGHGIGELFHCAPNIPHYSRNKAVGVMKAGQIFTIELMINSGNWRDRMWPDGWTAVTTDGKRSAQFEHTLLVTETGGEVLTARLPTSPDIFPWLTQ
ncbi:hypothetical protein L7F22_015634 [Adiantum nelumboides]|nr:hypothetical protein [Adiantum nelumboides]